MTKVIYLHISSAQGPVECELAVAKTVTKLSQAASQAKLELEIMEESASRYSAGKKSVLMKLMGEQAAQFASQWSGTIQWQFPSPLRPHHQRKNWFIGCFALTLEETTFDPTEIQIDTMRAQGAGGQHVNKTESCVRVTHLPTGIVVVSQSQRSQHANKKEALQRLAYRLVQYQEQHANQQTQQRWHQHYELERGNPVKVFKG